ncbi:MAG: hypothetical protein LBR58_04250 [Propionibacteriaceae bacterium]|jgi:hypothetical protein|nr:hypothetical protein [Propionibacteriaceae bacterium]
MTTNKTTEPVRPWSLWAVLACSYAAVAALGVSIFGVFWVMVHDFNGSCQLAAIFATEVYSRWRLLLAVVATLTALLPSIAAVISGYYAWAGFGWARVATLISFALSGLSLLLTPIAWAALPLTAVAAALAWVPASNSFYQRCAGARRPERDFGTVPNTIWYGPLPKYNV